MRRLLLEGMDDPEVITKLHRIHQPKRIAPKRQGNLKHTRSKPLHRLGYSCLAAFGGDTQGIDNCFPRTFRKVIKGLSRRRKQEMGRINCIVFASRMLAVLPTAVKLRASIITDTDFKNCVLMSLWNKKGS
jgi:hypothetical protein